MATAPLPARLGASDRLAVLIGTWFGSGLSPKAPGTMGSLAALPFAWAILHLGGPKALAAGAALVFLAGWWAAGRLIALTGGEDPQLVVADEVVGQWLTLAVVPFSPLACLAGFALFRLFDITKPFPVSWADNLGGGFGVMLDDVLAGVYAGLCLWLLFHFLG